MADSPDLNASDVLRLTITSNGAQLDDSIQVVSVAVSKATSRIPLARIVLLDGDMPEQDFPLSNSDSFKPGAEIEIKAGYDQDEESIFQGVVVKHGIKISGGNYSRLVIECRDKAAGMTIGRKNANYIDSTDSAVISRLIGNCSGLSADVESTSISYPELVQYYCTDWDFMLSRAEVNGLLVIVDDGKVTVKPPQTSAAPVLGVTYGADLMEFHADLDARTQLTSVKVTAWDLKNQAIVESQEVKPPTLNSQGNLASADLATVVGPDSFRLQTVAPLEKTALDNWAGGQQLKAGLARIQGNMKFQGSARARVGTLIELKGVGDRFNGQVFVSGVSHDIADGNWTTEVDFGISPSWFADKRDLTAPPAAGLVPGVDGLQIGVVKKLDQDPDGQGKIQVSVPVLQAETAGVWARLASFYASNGIGSFFIPEIGDEVVLGYFNSDPSYPVILGSLYSSGRKAAYELTPENNTKAIVTRSKLKIEFDDEKKITTIITPGNNQIVLSDDGKSILLQDQNSNKVELNSGGILLDSPKDIQITAKGKISISATGAIETSSKADVSVSGQNVNNTAQVGFVAKGNATAEISASGQTTVKGAMVMIN